MNKSVLRKIWRALADAIEQRSAFTMLQLATIGEDGAPKVRTIVLRGVVELGRSVTFITDLRSPKIREIRADPRVSLLGFDADAGLQLRMEGHAEIIEGEAERRSAWDNLRPHTHILFRTPLAPGTVMKSARTIGAQGDPGSTGVPHPHFGLVRVVLEKLDWLDLSTEPHSRCAFRHEENKWIGTRIAP